MKKINILWAIALVGLLGGCVKDEIFKGPPTISNVTMTPVSPLTMQAVTVSAKVTDLNGLKSVVLNYKTEAQTAYQQITMTGTSGIFTAQIPGQDGGSTINYYLTASNIFDMKTNHPANAPTSTAAYTVGAARIVMNEIYSRGTTAEPDWIEIYNDSDVAVDLAGYKIYDNGGQGGTKPKMEFPAGAVIPARGFYVIVTDIPVATNPAGFGLSSTGEEVWLENKKGNLIDNVAFPALDVTQTFGRKPNGGTWQVLNTITKGTSNN